MSGVQQLPVRFINFALHHWNQIFQFLRQVINDSHKITTQLFPTLSLHAIHHQEEIHKLLMRVQDAKRDESDGGAKQLQVFCFLPST